MTLDVPVGRCPGLGRKRPYTIGDSADVEAAQSMYPSITNRAMTSFTVVGHSADFTPSGP